MRPVWRPGVARPPMAVRARRRARLSRGLALRVLCVLCVLRVLRGLCGLSAVAGWGSAGCAGSAAVRECTVGGPRTRTRGASWCVAHSNQPRPLQRSRGQGRHGRVRRPSAGRGGPTGGAGARSAREPLGVIRGGCGGEGGKRPLRPAQGQGWGEEGQGVRVRVVGVRSIGVG